MSNLATIHILKDIFQKPKDSCLTKTQIYVISSLKYQEDIQELKRIFGLNFFLVGCGSSKKPELDKNLNNKLNELFKKDKIQKIFEKCDIFLNLDDECSMEKNLTRFLDLIFSNPFLTPTKDEYFMSLAYNVASRSLSLNRQVGAVLVSENHEILSIGCNEVPKKGGGQYWDSDENDSREFKLIKREKKTSDSNKLEIDKIKQNLTKKICEKLELIDNNLKDCIQKGIDESEINNLIEFYREEHAEEEAIIACARNGNSTRKSILYCTAFPCHLCTKKIVAAGIEKVIYIEPYPKSKIHLFKDSVKINDDLTGAPTTFTNNVVNPNNDKVVFEQFKGVGPTRYFDLFSLNLSNGIELKRTHFDLNSPPPKKPRMHKNNFFNLVVNFFEGYQKYDVNESELNDQVIKQDEIEKIVLKLNKEIEELKKIYDGIENLCKSIEIEF